MLERMIEAKRPLGLDSAKKFEKELGYSAAAERKELLHDEDALFQACLATGVRPFKTEAVETYKKKAKRSAAIKSPAGRWVLGLLAAASMITIVCIILSIFVDGIWLLSIFLAVPFFVAAICIYGSGLFKWHRIEINKYDKPIPTDVTEMALNLKKRVPTAKFQIDELFDELFVKKRFYEECSFLVARSGKAELYLARWDKADFLAGYE